MTTQLMSFKDSRGGNQTVFTVNGRKMILWEDNVVRPRKNFNNFSSEHSKSVKTKFDHNKSPPIEVHNHVAAYRFRSGIFETSHF